jgi:DNA-binding LytR/AlgR family response regulator
MKKIMNCLIADDEPLARKGMEHYVREVPFLRLTATCNNALQVMDMLRSNEIDLLFLDIEMPKLSGIDMLKSLREKPITIMTTAFPDYALTGYELDVMDYLIKPIPFERFMKAVNKAHDYFLLKERTDPPPKGTDYFFVKSEQRLEKILYADVLFIQALQNYVVIQTSRKKYISYLTMKSVEDQMPPEEFVKISKSCIVSLSKIDSIEGNVIRVGSQEFTIGRTIREEVMKRILDNRLLKRL